MQLRRSGSFGPQSQHAALTTRPSPPTTADAGNRSPPSNGEAAPRPEAATAVPQGDMRFRSALETARLVVAPTTLFTAVLFYFGWVYTASRALYFGIDPSTLGYSTQDYILRSADPVFLPVTALLIVGLGVVWLHASLWRWITTARDTGAVRFAGPALVAAGVALVANGVAGVVDHPLVGPRNIVTPASLGAGVGLVAYGVCVRRRWSGCSPGGADRPESPRWLPSVSSTLVILILIATLFAAVGDWADGIGRQRAILLAHRIPDLPGVVVYSPQRLQVDAAGVRVETVGDADSAYRFRYSGLKLLIRSGGKYFLIPARWNRTDGVTLVLPDRDNLRFEFTPR